MNTSYNGMASYNIFSNHRLVKKTKLSPVEPTDENLVDKLAFLPAVLLAHVRKVSVSKVLNNDSIMNNEFIYANLGHFSPRVIP